MEKIKSYFLNYFKKSSWLKIISDFLFYSFILLLLIPGTRKPLSEFIIKTTMLGPRVRIENPEYSLTSHDYSLIFKDMNGTVHQLGDFRGKVILINFWASWCPPCRAEMPAFQKLYNEFGNRMVFLFIADDQKTAIDKFISEFNLNLPVFFLEYKPSEALSYKALPTTILINNKGEVVLNKKGASRWNSTGFKKKLEILIGQN